MPREELSDNLKKAANELLDDLVTDEDAEYLDETEYEAEWENEDQEEAFDSDVDEQEEEEAESPEEDKTKELFDKELQRIQQARATLERAAARAEENPTISNVQKAEKAQSKLERLLEKADDEVDPYSDIKMIAEEVEHYRDETQSKLDDYEALIAQQQEQIRASQRFAHKMETITRRPDLADKYDSMYSELLTRMNEYASMGGGQIPAPVWDKLASETWEQIEAKHPASSSKNDTSEKKPKNTKPVRSKAGLTQKDDSDNSGEKKLDSLLEDIMDKNFRS